MNRKWALILVASLFADEDDMLRFYEISSSPDCNVYFDHLKDFGTEIQYKY